MFMNIDELLKNNPWIYNVFNSILAILIAIIIYLLISKIFISKLETK